ncbi:hypothetical protein UFOVP605_39 [uncultured Caudovirales phage]|uniref:Uncharacterized protein n=1 Tax=uncultured Caudovirales phage TaxID=2100421 RepID=A0A6J5N7A4_9CAUD|nr:hypothetical protein UFOVP605_39 [uncultured Caudovirales phage]
MKILGVLTGWASDGKPYSIDVVHVRKRHFAVYIQGEGVVQSYWNKAPIIELAERIANSEKLLDEALAELRNPRQLFGPPTMLY